MAQFFPESAHNNINRKVFNEEYTRIFGEPKKQFCDDCDKRLSFCECKKEESEQTNN